MTLGVVRSTDCRERSRARVLPWCAVSLALHLVVTRLPARLDVAAVIEPTNAASAFVPSLSEIPVEMPAEPEAPEPSPPPAAPTRATKERDPADRTEPAREEGVQAGGVTGADADVSEAGAGGNSSFADLDLEPSRPGDRLMFDPFRAARERSSAGVRALIDSPRLRRHPFGAAVGALLARVDPSGSLGPKGIDPIHEAQRIFVQSPGLRDSSEVVMLVQHRIADADLRARLARPITPSSSLVVVAPERLAPIATELASLVALPPSPPPSFIWAHVETPWRAFLETPVSLPRSLRWIEVRIAPDSDGGMTLRFEAEDEEERSAPLDARSIAAAISVALHLLASADVAREPSPEQVPVIEFHARSSIIVGTCRFSAAQVADLVERIRSRLGETAATP